MMHQPLVEIKKPCHETLADRRPNEQGKYCKTCRLTIVDFTGMKPNEIAEYLSNNDLHCGTFNRKDIYTGSRAEKFVSYLQTRNLKFAAVVLLSFILLVSCRVRRGKVIHGSSGFGNKQNPSIENLN